MILRMKVHEVLIWRFISLDWTKDKDYDGVFDICMDVLSATSTFVNPPAYTETGQWTYAYKDAINQVFNQE